MKQAKGEQAKGEQAKGKQGAEDMGWGQMGSRSWRGMEVELGWELGTRWAYLKIGGIPNCFLTECLDDILGNVHVVSHAPSKFAWWNTRNLGWRPACCKKRELQMINLETYMSNGCHELNGEECNKEHIGCCCAFLKEQSFFNVMMQINQTFHKDVQGSSVWGSACSTSVLRNAQDKNVAMVQWFSTLYS
jgi:hypothetical protein